MNGRWERIDRSGAERTILVVGEEPLVRRPLARAFALQGVRTLEATELEEALAMLRTQRIDALITDQAVGPISGLELLERAREEFPETQRIVLCEQGDAWLAQRAVNRAGVSYLLPKPWEADAIEEVISRLEGTPAPTPTALARRERRGAEPDRYSFSHIIGESTAIRELLELVCKVAETDSTALITGETGTGKELIGRAIHAASRRSERVFSAVNSAAFPETLLESELFGHRRGAFTGASSNAKGLFEHADKGTVFLDEVAEMPLSMQAKLLRFLQTGEIRPVGGEVTRYVDVRLITATNKDLEKEVAAGRFREDLYYRLAVIPIEVPALRQRSEDIPLLARHFLSRMAEKTGRTVEQIDERALHALQAYRWPGNVRELENVIERAVALTRSERIMLEDLPSHVRSPRRDLVQEDSIQSLPGIERRHILETLDRVGWNRKRAAELLEISTTTLWRRLKEFGIDGDARGRADRVTVNG